MGFNNNEVNNNLHNENRAYARELDRYRKGFRKFFGTASPNINVDQLVQLSPIPQNLTKKQALIQIVDSTKSFKSTAPTRSAVLSKSRSKAHNRVKSVLSVNNSDLRHIETGGIKELISSFTVSPNINLNPQPQIKSKKDIKNMTKYLSKLQKQNTESSEDSSVSPDYFGNSPELPKLNSDPLDILKMLNKLKP